MSEQKPRRALKHPRTAACLALVLGVATLTGCAGKSETLDPAGGSAMRAGDPELIGGQPADADRFRATVGIGDACTAAKVGPRLFLTAAHCVAVGRPLHGQPVAEDFPPNQGVHDNYLPGKRLLIYWGLSANDKQQGEFTVAKTTIHPSWWTCPLCQDPILEGDAADVALIEIREQTPQIPEARVELGAIATGAQVVKVGWGCEERTNVDPNTVHLGRYKTANASIIAVAEVRRFDERITDEQLEALDASYLVTAGHAQDEQRASLCLGDSGGPLYLRDDGEPRIVGINADYSFKPSEDPEDLGGVSWTDWHTRTSLRARHGVGQWLIDLQVKTVGGSNAR